LVDDSNNSPSMDVRPYLSQRGISVIMPVYNGQDYLQQAISSVLAQTNTEFELVISDDGSTDGSREIISSFSDRRVRVLPPDRRGLFENLNRLIREARYPLVHILCQDDVMAPGCLEEEMLFMAARPRLGMVFSKYLSIDEDDRVVLVSDLGDLPERMSPSLALQCLFYHGCIPGNLSTVCVRKNCFESVGLFDASFGVSADYEMWVRISERWEMGVCHKHLLKIRTHEKQLSHARGSGLDFIVQNQRIRSRLLPLLPTAIREAARSYERQRPRVLSLHFGMGQLFRGDFKVLLTLAHAFGPQEFLLTLFFWLVTMNNHLYRPSPEFSIPERDRRSVQALAERSVRKPS
jgi:glycosyltransferase involved in cell wall biosynthesis